jgi:restriction system protein
MEKHLEEFLVQNWSQTELGTKYDIFEDDGQRGGQQYPTDTGPMDILAISKDRRRLLVVELKRGRASDDVVGQTLRYMGYVKDELAEEGQSVAGAIIAPEADRRLQRALAMVPSVDFYHYEISFTLTRRENPTVD